MATTGRRDIHLIKEDGWWVAKDEHTGVTSQGRTRTVALDNLDEAVEGYKGAGSPPSDDDLRDLGINPEENTSGSLEDSALFE